MRVIIKRGYENDKQTVGRLYIIQDHHVIFDCATLELPPLDNKVGISSVPLGIYKVKKRISPKFGESFILTDVPGRSYILIHQGNYHTDIRGCILAGSGLKDINKDGYMDVINSGNTVKKLLSILPSEFNLIIE